MANVPILMIDAVDTVSQVGAPVYTIQAYAGSFTMTFGDTSVAGTVQIQGSNEPNTRGNGPTYVPSNASFNNIVGATSTITAGVCNAIIIPVLTFQYIRAVFTYTSGGSSTIIVNGNLFTT